MPKICDYSNQKFNKLLAIKYTGKTNNHRSRIWLFKCDCGNDFEYSVKDVVAGRIKGCKQCSNKKYSKEESISYNIWSCQYADGDITFDDWKLLCQLNCYHCDCLPSNCRMGKLVKNNISFTYNGLDRLDNNRGHDLDNVVPCCWNCNNMRGKDNLGDFYNKISKIYHNRLVSGNNDT